MLSGSPAGSGRGIHRHPSCIISRSNNERSASDSSSQTSSPTLSVQQLANVSPPLPNPRRSQLNPWKYNVGVFGTGLCTFCMHAAVEFQGHSLISSLRSPWASREVYLLRLVHLSCQQFTVSPASETRLTNAPPACQASICGGERCDLQAMQSHHK